MLVWKLASKWHTVRELYVPKSSAGLLARCDCCMTSLGGMGHLRFGEVRVGCTVHVHKPTQKPERTKQDITVTKVQGSTGTWCQWTACISVRKIELERQRCDFSRPKVCFSMLCKIRFFHAVIQQSKIFSVFSETVVESCPCFTQSCHPENARQEDHKGKRIKRKVGSLMVWINFCVCAMCVCFLFIYQGFPIPIFQGRVTEYNKISYNMKHTFWIKQFGSHTVVSCIWKQNFKPSFTVLMAIKICCP